jgi:hypothetical protein
MLFMLACTWPMAVDNQSGVDLDGVRIYRSGHPDCNGELGPAIPDGEVVDVPVSVPQNAYVNVEWTWADGRCVLMPYFTLAETYTLTESALDEDGGCECE